MFLEVMLYNNWTIVICELCSLTQNSDGIVGLKLGVIALYHIDSWVHQGDRAQSESSSEDVDRRSAAVTGEDCLLVPQPG